MCKGNIRQKDFAAQRKAQSSTSKESLCIKISRQSCLFFYFTWCDWTPSPPQLQLTAASVNCWLQSVQSETDCSTIWPVQKNHWFMKWKFLICVYQYHKDKGYHFYIILHNCRSVPQVRGALESFFSCWKPFKVKYNKRRLFIMSLQRHRRHLNSPWSTMTGEIQPRSLNQSPPFQSSQSTLGRNSFLRTL